MGDLERLTRDYWRAVERVRRLAVPERDKLLVLADLEVIYRRERADSALQGADLPKLDL